MMGDSDIKGIRLGWHMFSNSRKIYKALEPASKGVLVFRDVNHDNALTQAGISQGIQVPNNTINIHGSGVGSFNFSAGCQVIAGKSYENAVGEKISCADFAAKNNRELGAPYFKTKGAHNVRADLIVAYSPLQPQYTLRYTLGRESILSNVLGMKVDLAGLIHEVRNRDFGL